MIKLVAFKSAFDNRGMCFEKTWEHIVAKLSKPVVTADKKACALISPTIYADSLDGFVKTKEETNAKGKVHFEWESPTGEKRTTDGEGNITRANVNVVGVSMLIFDFDSGKSDVEAIAKPWEDYNYVIHSTWSHTAEQGKYRLIVPLKNTLTPEEFKGIWEDVASIAGDIDISCKDVSRMFYWPAHKPGAQDLHFFKAVMDKKFYSPKVKAPKPKKIKRGDYTTLDVVKWFAHHDAYIGSANKNGQHWVKCPWGNEHTDGIQGETDSCIYESEGNWPTFACSHNSCQQQERNITQVISVWGDADQFCTRAMTKEAVKTSTNIKCLGHDDNNFYYYQATKTNHVVRLKPGDHNELNFYNITPDIDYWFKHWGKEDNGRVDWKAAARTLVGRCQDAGFFKPTSVRGAGVWFDEGRIVAHLGDHLRVDGERVEITQFKSDHIYESAVQTIKWQPPAEAAEAFKLAELINQLPIPDPIERFLLSGHCVASMLSGSMRWRPHVWITGDSGSGKTTIVSMLNNLWTPLGGLFQEGRTSESGIRQKVKHNAIPIIVDEVESNTKDDAIRVEGLIALARSASSDSNAGVAKGTISGQGLEFLVKTCFTFSSVVDSLKWSQDKERFATIRVMATKESRDGWPVLRTMIEQTVTKAFSLKLFSRSSAMAQVIRKNCDVFSEAIIKTYPKATSRNADQIGTHCACAWSLRGDSELTVDQAKAVLAQFKGWEKFWNKEELNAGNTALDEIMSRFARGDGAKQHTVGELVFIINNPVQTSAFDDSLNERHILERHGLKVEEGHFWISRTSSELAKLLATGNATSYYQSISGMKNAQHKVITYMGIQNPSTGIPLEYIFRDRSI